MPLTLDAAMAETQRLIRIRHYAYRTEQTYMAWLSQYRNFVQKSGLPWDAPDTARAFLAQLALQRGVAASTQNQAFSAVLFLLREVLGRDTVRLNSVRAKRGSHLPVVLSEREVTQVLGSAMWSCRTHWQPNIQKLRGNGVGNTFFPRRTGLWTRVPGLCGVIT